MDPKYLPKDIHGIMDHVTEELAEVNIEAGHLVRVIGKFHRFGPNSMDPRTVEQITNWDRIKLMIPKVHLEILDLIGSLQRLEAAMAESDAKESTNGIPPPTAK